MKTKLIIFAIIALFFGACEAPQYLPTADSIHLNQFGSYIKIERKAHKPSVKGELIAVGNDHLVVLSESNFRCTTVPITEISNYTLRYATAKKYGWSIPLLLLYPFMHGFVSIFTIPMHLIFTISTTSSSNNDFRYNNYNLPYDELRMFARFPQGIPADVDITLIR